MSILPKKVLMERIDRFLADKKRGISAALFANVAGITEDLFKKNFILKSVPMSEATQIRVSRALKQWEDGEIAVMQGMYNTRFTEYRRVPKPRMYRHLGLQVVDGRVKMDVGIRNRADYSRQRFGEQLEGKQGD
jgi:hypothetical protein